MALCVALYFLAGRAMTYRVERVCGLESPSVRSAVCVLLLWPMYLLGAAMMTREDWERLGR